MSDSRDLCPYSRLSDLRLNFLATGTKSMPIAGLIFWLAAVGAGRAPDGNYLQVDGIKRTLERRDAASQRHFHAHSLQPDRIHPDGTILAFGRGQEIRLVADEWLAAGLVADASCGFLKREVMPGFPAWREISGLAS